ncbi:MAG: neutral/alkaline non-lysosomal ceramidase N-terminal domain-containing protein, partial [Planctomycetaceae bacterium]
MLGRLIGLSLLVGVAAFAVPDSVSAGDWQAGVARTNITPQEPMWMSGYASRNHGADGKLTELWAKAIVIADPDGHRIAAVTLDLVGLDRETSLAMREGIEHALQIPRANVALFCSHTHTGPVVGNNLRSMFELNDAENRKIDVYTSKLIADVVQTVGNAAAEMEPVTLAWACGTATYAVNRRTNKEADVPMLRERGLLNGPVDHDVPVLSVRAGEKLKAVLFGYACHATVLDLYQWTGDHPGFAMKALEEQLPGTQAMFWAGCGADQNPLPRRTVELAKKYGEQLARSVRDVLDGAMHPISGELKTVYTEIEIGFASIPTKEQL